MPPETKSSSTEFEILPLFAQSLETKKNQNFVVVPTYRVWEAVDLDPSAQSAEGYWVALVKDGNIESDHTI